MHLHVMIHLREPCHYFSIISIIPLWGYMADKAKTGLKWSWTTTFWKQICNVKSHDTRNTHSSQWPFPPDTKISILSCRRCTTEMEKCGMCFYCRVITNNPENIRHSQKSLGTTQPLKLAIIHVKYKKNPYGTTGFIERAQQDMQQFGSILLQIIGKLHSWYGSK